MLLIAAVQQSDSVIYICIYYIHTYMYILFIFISIMVYHKILNIVLCAMQQDLVFYPFYI